MTPSKSPSAYISFSRGRVPALLNPEFTRRGDGLVGFNVTFVHAEVFVEVADQQPSPAPTTAVERWLP